MTGAADDLARRSARCQDGRSANGPRIVSSTYIQSAPPSRHEDGAAHSLLTHHGADAADASSAGLSAQHHQDLRGAPRGAILNGTCARSTAAASRASLTARVSSACRAPLLLGAVTRGYSRNANGPGPAGGGHRVASGLAAVLAGVVRVRRRDATTIRATALARRVPERAPRPSASAYDAMPPFWSSAPSPSVAEGNLRKTRLDGGTPFAMVACRRFASSSHPGSHYTTCTQPRARRWRLSGAAAAVLSSAAPP